MTELLADVIEFPTSGPELPEGATERWGSLRFHHHGRTALPVGRSTDGREVLVASGTLLLVLDRDTGLPRRLLRTNFNVRFSAFIAPGVALLCTSREVYRWQHEGDELSLVADLCGYTDAMGVSANGSMVAIAVGDRRIALMDPASSRVMREVERAPGEIQGLALSGDGAQVATIVRTHEWFTQFDRGSEITLLEVWETASGALVFHREYTGRLPGALSFTEDGERLVLQDSRGVTSYDARTGETLEADDRPVALNETLASARPPGFAEEPLSAISAKASLSPEGRFVATRNHLVDLAAGAIRRLPSDGTSFSRPAFPRAGECIYRLGSLGGLERFALPDLTPFPALDGLPSKYYSAVVAPDGTWGAFGESAEGYAVLESTRIYVMDLPQLTLRTTLVFPGSSIRYLRSSPDSAWLLAEGSPGGRTVRFCLEHPEASSSEVLDLSQIATIQLCAGGGRLVCEHRGEKGVTMRDARTGKAEGAFLQDVHHLSAIALSPDGRWLAAGDGWQIRLVDLDAERELSPLDGHLGHVQWLCFTLDGRSLFSISADGTLLRWDLPRIVEMCAMTE